MKKTVLTYGVIAGLITTVMMIISTTLHNQNLDFREAKPSTEKTFIFFPRVILLYIKWIWYNRILSLG